MFLFSKDVLKYVKQEKKRVHLLKYFRDIVEKLKCWAQKSYFGHNLRSYCGLNTS